MATLTNSFSGGTSGVTLTQGSGGNTGGTSGDFFDIVNKASDAILQFDSAAAYGGSGLGLRCATRTTSGSATVEWASQLASATDHYGRTYIRVGAAPSVNGNIVRFYSDALSQFGNIRLNVGTNTLSIIQGASTVMATSSNALTSGNWYRLEWHVHADASAAFINVRIYNNPDSGTALEDFGATATWAGLTDVGAMIVGVPTSTNFPSATTYLDFDNVGMGATTWMGPIPGGSTVTISPTSAVSFAVGSVYEVDSQVLPISSVSAASGRAPTFSGSNASVQAPAARSTAVARAPSVQRLGATVSPPSAISRAIARGLPVSVRISLTPDNAINIVTLTPSVAETLTLNQDQ